MRLATFQVDGENEDRIGAVADSRIVDLSVVFPELATSLSAVVQAGSAEISLIREYVAAAFEDSATGQPGTSPTVHLLSAVDLRAPIPSPPRLRDYVTFDLHVSGSGFEVPTVFAEMPTCYKGNHMAVGGDGDLVPWPAYSDQLDFEAEFGVYVCRHLRDASVKEAAEAIAGYSLFNDFSARDVQMYEMAMNLGPGKGKDFFNSIGPTLVTPDEIEDERAIAIEVVVDGDTWAFGDASTMMFSVAEVVAWASYGEDLYPGEFIALGTLPGGSGLEIGRWIQPGQTVELRSPQLGTLRNVIGPKDDPPEGSGLPSFRGAPRIGAS